MLRPIENLAPVRRGMTAREYFALPENHPRCELIEGELWMAPAPFTIHQDLVRTFTRLLDTHCLRTGCGTMWPAPVDVRFDDGTVLQPDIVFIRAGRARERDIRGPVVIVPDLCIEIVSPDSSSRDHVRKRRIYERHGVAEYWIADPREKLLAFYRLRHGRYEEIAPRAGRYRSEAVPGFTLALARFWREARGKR